MLKILFLFSGAKECLKDQDQQVGDQVQQCTYTFSFDTFSTFCCYK